MSRSPRSALFPTGFRPERGDVVNAACGAVLTTLGLIGFRSAFGGLAWLGAGLAGVVAGAAVGYALARARVPLLVGTAAGLVGFFLVGAVALRPDALGGVVPTPATFVALLRGAVQGWADLLTAVPPVGASPALLVIPLLCGYAGALLTTVLAVTVRRLHVCVLPASGVLALSVLCGVREPASLLLQGGVFGVVAIAWMSYRESGKHRAVVDTGRLRRQVAGAGLLIVTAAGALVLGPNLPWGGDRPRYVLRDRTEPPFDPSRYPSPLVAYRRYTDDTRLALKDKVLFTVKAAGGAALADGQRIRLAVMDEYDGVVWAVTGRGSAVGGSFERVGDRLPESGPAREGQVVDLTFEIRDLPRAIASRSGVWMPVAGTVQAVSFGGPRPGALTDSFRFDQVTSSAAVPLQLTSGDSYRLTTRLVPDPPAEALAGRRAAGYTALPIPDLPQGLIEIAQDRTAGATDAKQQVDKLVEWLRKGFYSDGGGASNVAPGHSIRRLEQFLGTEQPTGDAEQYAAALAVLARALGLPARVVLGFAVPTGTAAATVEVKGADVDAWVEIAFDGLGWVGFHPTPDKSQTPTPEVQTRPQPKREESSIDSPPPPSTVPPPKPEVDDPEDEPRTKKRDAKKGLDGAGGLPRVALLGGAAAGVPLATAGTFAAVVVGLKRRRRHRRRTSGPPADRIAGAWSELVDQARDLGEPVPPVATRMELVALVALPGSAAIARAADAALFGLQEPTDAAATALWNQVDETLAASTSPRPRPERIRAAVSLTSLRSP
jgi:transglutaminase-like putative cysteine protease